MIGVTAPVRMSGTQKGTWLWAVDRSTDHLLPQPKAVSRSYCDGLVTNVGPAAQHEQAWTWRQVTAAAGARSAPRVVHRPLPAMVGASCVGAWASIDRDPPVRTGLGDRQDPGD